MITDDFWEASSLNSYTIRPFADKANSYEPQPSPIDPLAVNAPVVALPSKRDRLQRLLERRRSSRTFGSLALTLNDLGRVLSSLAAVGPNQRLYPGAGGLGAVEVYVLALDVDGLASGAHRYMPVEHGLAEVEPNLPTAADVDRLCSLEGNRPAAVLIFALRTSELHRKYGERGTRFGFIEVGHACQNVALRLADLGLSGYQLGGVLEPETEELLRIGVGRARVTLGYAIGTS